MQGGLTQADWPQIDERELTALARRLPQVWSAPVPAARPVWHSQRPFGAAARVAADHGEVFIKRHDPRVRDVASLREEHCFLHHLHERGFAATRVLADPGGESAFAIGAWTYEVHQIAPGVDAYRDAVSWTNVRCPAHARALGRALAQLHQASAGFVAPERAPRPLLAGVAIIGAQDLAEALRRFVAAHPQIGQFLDGQGTNWHQQILDACAGTHEQLRGLIPALMPLWVHNDLHASNAFWTDRSELAQVRAVIDFGLCNLGWAMSDLATALERNTIAWLELEESGGEGAGAIGRIALALALIDGYCELRTPSPEERRALPLLLELAHLEYSLSEVEYFHGIVANDVHARLAYPKFLLGHVRWFGSRAGREYLAAVRQRLLGAPA